jgi:hypothetical protein
MVEHMVSMWEVPASILMENRSQPKKKKKKRERENEK